MLTLILLFLSIFNSPNLCVCKKFYYIYEWPEVMSDVWPPPGAVLDKGTPYSHSFRSNFSGVGTLLNPEIGYFDTWQFSFYKLAMARLLVDEHRTMDPSKATSFIIPYDIGLHSLLDHNNGKLRVASPHGRLAWKYISEAVNNPVFWKNGGHDHFILYSVTAYQISGITSKMFMTDPKMCENCTMLTIETSPTNTARRYYSDKSRKWWYAIPYPSSFHYWEGIKSPPWIRSSSDPPRKYTSIFIGSVKTTDPDSNKLRSKLQVQCKEHGDTCLWFHAAHSCTGLSNNTDNMLLYRESVFCLAPPGDSQTRKSLFDSLLAGCIPVIFAKGTMSQYSWHLPTDLESVAVYISKQDVIEGTNFLTVLNSISPEKIKSMQDKIEQIAPNLQYSVVPPGYGTPRTRVFPGEESTLPSQYPRGPVWKPPVPDAMDIIIERILDRKTVEPMEGFTPEFVEKTKILRDEAECLTPEFYGWNSCRKVTSTKPGEKKPKPKY